MKDKTMKLDLQMFATASTQNQNTTGASGMSAEMKTFYEKRLIDQAEPALVHDQFGDPYPIPANGGKNIEVPPEVAEVIRHSQEQDDQTAARMEELANKA